MAKKILTVGFQLASDNVEYEEFTSKASLLDWDIVLFRPMIDQFISYSDQYQGKPSLSDSTSFQLKESSEHWRREIKEAVEAGKTVIVYLSPVQQVYIDTGKRQYSGTGRNQKTTRVVDLYTNYSCIPEKLNPTIAKGSSIKLSVRGAEALAPYWSEFGEVSEYNAILTDEGIPSCLVTKDGNKSVGALYMSKNSSGALICLPDINFNAENFFRKEEDQTFWTNEAELFAVRLLSSLVSLDVALHKSGEATPEPSWAAKSTYSLSTERGFRIELLEAERKLEEAQKLKEELLEKLKSAGRLRGLLFEKGKPLESSIIDALQLMGFNATSYKDATSEFDVVFNSAEGRLIGEAEGKDNKAINIDKLRQLSMNIHEDLQREEVATPAKGVLFGNGYRLQPIADRETAFTAKCISAALTSSTALVATADLFMAAQYLAEQQDEVFSMQCRQAILTAVGLTKFPEIPIRESLEETNIQT